MRPVIQSRQLDTAITDGISPSQTPGGAGNLTIDGVFASGGVATLDVQRRVIITSAADETARTFTITGTDEQGRVITEAVAGVDTAAATSVLDFFTITQIAVDAATTGAVAAGTSLVGGSIPIPIDQYLSPTNIGLATVFGAVAANVTVEHTFDDVFDGNPSALRTWFITTGWGPAGVSVDTDGNYAAPPRATRMLTNSGIGTVVFHVLQAGAIS